MRAFLGSVFLLLLAGCSPGAQRSELVLPEPPQQKAHWQPPADATIPTNLLSAVEILSAQGFPDPRGCEYREIEVEVSSVWAEQGQMVRTRGWVLPADIGATQQFAICWNGLIYPVGKVGEPADLAVEAVALTPPSERRFNMGLGEHISVFPSNSASSRVLLLLRAGETEAAVRNWVPDQQFKAQVLARLHMEGAEEAGNESYDPYLELAGDWAWGLFDQLLSAHMRGDQELALAVARQLDAVQTKIEAEAARRGFPREQYFASARRGQERPYLDFLEQLPEILADLERRFREGRRDSVVETGLERIPNQQKRIVSLIKDLDLVRARQHSQPGGVCLPGDPIVAALIREAEAAVEPLLDCLENDNRLTCSVGFHRDFGRHRTVVPVASAAGAALKWILQADFRGGAPEMRAFWRKYKGMNPEERWYVILKDDEAGMGRWLESANTITQLGNRLPVPGTIFSRAVPESTNSIPQVPGEALRSKSRPSVAELMARRAVEAPESSADVHRLADACQIGLRLGIWDPQAAVPVARTLVGRCRTVMQYSDQQSSWPVQRLGTFIARLTVVRADGNDPEALGEYAEWLKTTTPDQLDTYLKDSLEPMLKHPTDASVQAAAEVLFGETDSPLGQLPWKGAGTFNPVESDLVKVPSFRRMLVRELDKKEVRGHVEWREPDSVAFQLTNYLGGSRPMKLPEEQRPEPGTRAELRWADWIAWSLSNAGHIPAFNPLAPIEERDAAIEIAREKLNGP